MTDDRVKETCACSGESSTENVLKIPSGRAHSLAMCGCFTLTRDLKTIAERFGALPPPSADSKAAVPRYNIAPPQNVIVVGKGSLHLQSDDQRPSRSATTAAQSARTGARLIWILGAVIVAATPITFSISPSRPSFKAAIS